MNKQNKNLLVLLEMENVSLTKKLAVYQNETLLSKTVAGGFFTDVNETIGQKDIVDPVALRFSELFLRQINSPFEDDGTVKDSDRERYRTVIQQCQVMVTKASPQELEMSINNNMKHLQQLWSDITLIDLISDDDSKRVCSLILVTARIEFIISCMVKKRGHLKDNLQSKDIFGSIGNLTYVMQYLLGSVKGLNIKNLIWHGFISNVITRREICSFVLVCINTFNHLLRIEMLMLRNPSSKIDLVIPESMCQLDDRIAEEIVLASLLVHTEHRSLWRFVIHCKENHIKAHLNIILLQHVLRMMHVALVGCQTDRIKAQNTEFYVTFDEIFSPGNFSTSQEQEGQRSGASYYTSVFLLDRHEFETNLLLPLLGDRFYALMDIFIHGFGLRLRDKLSHGEIPYCDISKEVSQHVYLISMSILSLFSFEFSFVYPTKYSEQFHPRAMALNSISSISQCLDNFVLLSEFDIGERDSVDSQTYKEFEVAVKGTPKNSYHTETAYFIGPFRIIFYKVLVSTLQNFSIFSRGLQESVNDKIDCYKSRTLRSRGRKNLNVILSILPTLVEFLQLLSDIFFSIESKIWAIKKETKEADLLLKNVQFLQKCSENSVSFLSKNKWEDVVKHLIRFLQKYNDPNGILQL